jgi:hypothetical protein
LLAVCWEPVQYLYRSLVATNAEYLIINHLDTGSLKIEFLWEWAYKACAGHNPALTLPVSKGSRIRGCNGSHEVMDLLSRLLPQNLPISRFSTSKIASLSQIIGLSGDFALNKLG